MASTFFIAGQQKSQPSWVGSWPLSPTSRLDAMKGKTTKTPDLQIIPRNNRRYKEHAREFLSICHRFTVT